jgi:hypothetical protein
MSTKLPPQPSAQAGRLALSTLLREKNLLAALEVFRAELGDARNNLLGFNPIMLSSPRDNRSAGRAINSAGASPPIPWRSCCAGACSSPTAPSMITCAAR